jgi:hypothetical protein
MLHEAYQSSALFGRGCWKHQSTAGFCKRALIDEQETEATTKPSDEVKTETFDGPSVS